MREIKFRAWRPEYGMTEPFTLGNLQDEEQFDFRDGSYLSADEFGLEHEDTIVEQYTGLKDKNGTEIYAGDIFKGKCYGHEYCVVVTFMRGGFSPFAVADDEHYITMQAATGEVIGNIHENPELRDWSDD